LEIGKFFINNFISDLQSKMEEKKIENDLLEGLSNSD
jgi:hypothetical protein